MPRSPDSAKSHPPGWWHNHAAALPLGHDSGPLIYAASLVFGAVLVLLTFPLWALTGGLPPGAPPTADFATHVVGQRYFLATPWHWPLLTASRLIAPWGVNIAFTDSNPLAVLAAKLLRPMLPPFDQVVTVWQAVCWLLQPVSAVFAVRSAGERRALPACAAAVMAAFQPAFLGGLWHSALNSHFTILGAIGLYFRIVRGSTWAPKIAALLLPVMLLVHPYLLVMNAAILSGAPLTLLWRRDPAWRRATAWMAAGLAVAALLAVALGYTRGQSPGGYGLYGLNLASPFYPFGSALFPGFVNANIGAIGGQKSTYTYLGAGMIMLLVIACFIAMSRIRRGIGKHRGLAVVCAALFLLAVSNRVHAGPLLLFKVHTGVGQLQMVRASSRLFWPVTYVLLIGGVAAVAAARPRLAFALLPTAALLQFLDGGILRAANHATLYHPQPWLFDPEKLRSITAGTDILMVLPPFGCAPKQDLPLMQALWIASETLAATTTMYVAREEHPPSCDLIAALSAPPAPGVLLLLLPGFRNFAVNEGWANVLCRQLANYTVCAQETALLNGLEPLAAAQGNERPGQ